jgi:hypothetical protein
MGGHGMGASDGMSGGKMEVMGDMMGPMGKGQAKDHIDMSDMKKGAHMSGEMSRDAGKTWSKTYDLICKK